MENIIDIAKQDLGTYKAELASVGALYNLSEADYWRAYNNIKKLADELAEFLAGN